MTPQPPQPPRASESDHSPHTLRCDNCDRPLEAGNAAPGSKLRCPDCGDVKLVPEDGTSRDADRINSPPPRPAQSPTTQSPPDRASAAGYPPADGPEVEVLRLRPAMARAAPIRFALLLLLTLGGGAAAIAFGLVAPLIWAAILGLIAFVTGAIALLTWKVLTLTEGLTITTKRTIDRHGLLSRQTSEVLHADIRNIRIDQTFLQRLFRVGDLAISSAADDDQEVFMAKVPRPDEVREVIDLYRRL